MRLLFLWLTLMSELQSWDGWIEINYEMTGRPIEYVFRDTGYNSTGIPLIAQTVYCENTLADCAEYHVPIKVSGMYLPDKYRGCIIIQNITCENPP